MKRYNQDDFVPIFGYFSNDLLLMFFCFFLEKKELDFMYLDAIEKKLSSQLLSFQKIGVAFAIRYEIDVYFLMKIFTK